LTNMTTNNIMNEDEIDMNCGLVYLSRMFYNMANELDTKNDENNKSDNLNKIEEYYLISAELNYSPAMANLGIFYENRNEYDKAIHYYLMAIEIGSEVYAMSNLADLYRKMKDYVKMEYYYVIAYTNYDDIISIYSLISHYSKEKNFDKMEYYYLIAVENPKFKSSSVNDRVISIFNIILILDPIENKSVNVKKQISKIVKKEDIMVFRNKIKLFTNLKNITECVICYEERLNIDLHCGHCVCVRCYPYVYLSPCPICRL
jgi:tetratricopeptide (TPR) repeat protein